MSRPTVVSLKQTCWACPSQWDGQLADGRSLYIRYRGNSGSVEASPEPGGDVWDAVDGTLLGTFDKPNGNPYDGVMGTDEMMLRTEGCLDWSRVGPLGSESAGKE